jgi:hypothetical protein
MIIDPAITHEPPHATRLRALRQASPLLIETDTVVSSEAVPPVQVRRLQRYAIDGFKISLRPTESVGPHRRNQQVVRTWNCAIQIFGFRLVAINIYQYHSRPRGGLPGRVDKNHAPEQVHFGGQQHCKYIARKLRTPGGFQSPQVRRYCCHSSDHSTSTVPLHSRATVPSPHGSAGTRPARRTCSRPTRAD